MSETTVTPTKTTPRPRKRTAAAKTTQPRQDPAPAPTETPTAAPSAVSEPTPAPSKAKTGAVISYQLDEDGPTVQGLVVGNVDGAEHRDAGLLVVPLPDAFVIPLDAVKD